ncbi:MAG: DUF6873 family GME fold protein [Peptostreptococcales bacterium]
MRKKVFLSEEANKRLKEYLSSKGFHVIPIKKTGNVYGAIASHPDIYVCKVKQEIIIEESQYQLIKEKLGKEDANYHIGKSVLENKYPGTIKYNAVALGSFFIHSQKYTDEKILEVVKKNEMQVINVKQGYTKCNTVIVDDNSIITSDTGIAKALRPRGIDILLIGKGQVKLPGFEYGFIGGASGKVGNEILFNGNLKDHQDFYAIKNFIEARGIEVKYFEDYPLEDIGSIMEI